MPLSPLAQQRNNLLRIKRSTDYLIDVDGECGMDYSFLLGMHLTDNPRTTADLFCKLFNYDMSIRHSDEIVIFRKDS